MLCQSPVILSFLLRLRAAQQDSYFVPKKGARMRMLYPYVDSRNRLNMSIALLVIALIVWVCLLRITKRADLKFWHFLCGSVGLFLILMIFVQPSITQPLARGVTALSGIVGSLTNTFDAYFKYGIIFVESGLSSITLRIDFECAGVIEIMAFVSLLLFFDVYSRYEKVVIGIAGTLCIVLFNVARIILICEIVHFCGVDAYSIAHTFIGRFFFYALTVMLYFYVFTKPQVVSMKIGGFEYEHASESA